MSTSTIHVERAKRWETNSWLAEWLANTVTYCRDNPEGKIRLETWVVQTFGEIEGRKLLAVRRMPPGKKLIGRDALFLQRAGLGGLQRLMLNKASIELGVSDDELCLYHEFVAENYLCAPERTKPAPKRRRDETATQWLARRHEALLQGHGVPNMNWQLTRAIALSEYDRVKDTTELLRSSMASFSSAIEKRAPSIIPSPEILGKSEAYIKQHIMGDAFRSRTYVSHLAHSCWSHAAELFEDLARRGLCTPHSIERAYMRDEELMWRLVSSCVRAYNLSAQLLGRVNQTVTCCDHFRPFFKRWRTTGGAARIELDEKYLAAHPLKSPMDLLVTEMMCTSSSKHVTFWEAFLQILDAHPAEARKFSAEAFEQLGDLAVVEDFLANMMQSPFGDKLRRHAILQGGLAKEPMLRHVSPMDTLKLTWEATPARFKHYGEASSLSDSVSSTWLRRVDKVSMWNALNQYYSSYDSLILVNTCRIFDEMWVEADVVLWEAAKELDRPGEPGRVAKEFGLVDPNDPNRLSFMKELLQKTQGKVNEIRRLEAAKTPAPAPTPTEYVDSFPATDSSEPSVRSGHAHVKETEDLRPKEKTKTKGAGNPPTAPEPPVDVEAEDRELDSYPAILPPDFKLPRKVAKVFHRLLDEMSSEDDETAPKRGQVRWNEFEKAMKRVGFAVVQTAGSSVRFDPPAITARPISFHRPHPDSILPPHLLKWIGARLKRTYGWKKATFEAAQTDD